MIALPWLGNHAVVHHGPLARAVFHGQKGDLLKRYGAGMADQLGALGLVVHALVRWSTQ